MKRGLKMIGEYAGGADDDSGLDIGGAGSETPMELDEPIDAESLNINLKVNCDLRSKFLSIGLFQTIFSFPNC